MSQLGLLTQRRPPQAVLEVSLGRVQRRLSCTHLREHYESFHTSHLLRFVPSGIFFLARLLSIRGGLLSTWLLPLGNILGRDDTREKKRSLMGRGPLPIL